MEKIKLPLEEYKQRLSVYDKQLHDSFNNGSVDDYKKILEEREQYTRQYGVIGTEIRDLDGHVIADAADLER